MRTVSRSVDRVFQIMALFGARRRPLSATEIRQALEMPHSSTVSVLFRLVALGYLEQSTDTKRYFPSLQLNRLCDLLPDGISGCSLPARLVDTVQARTGETTSLSRLDGFLTMPVYARTASYPGAHHVLPGRSGGLATQSVVGRALLSVKSDAELRLFMQQAEFWARRARVTATHDTAQVMLAINGVRTLGYLCAYDQLVPGVGAVSYPLPLSDQDEPLAITVAGPTGRIRRNADFVIEALREEIETLYGAARRSAGAPRRGNIDWAN